MIGRPVSWCNGVPGFLWGRTSNFILRNGRRVKGFLRSLFVLSSLFILFSPLLSAVTRTKTVEWSYGVGSSTGVLSGTVLQFPSINFRLPDAVAVRNAWLEMEGLSENNADITGMDIYFDQGTAAVTVRDTMPSAVIAYATGESLRLHVKCSLPPAVFANVTALNDYAAAVRLAAYSGARFNMLTLKLFVTYDYDDTSPVQVNTVRFPLKADWASSVASVQGAFAPGILSFAYNAEIGESGAPDFGVKQQWFELRGHRLSAGSATDGSIVARIGANAYAPALQFDGSLQCSYDFLYLTAPGTQPGFSLNTQQALSIETVQNTLYDLGGECVVTYEFSSGAPLKTKTVYYVLGQGLPAGSAVQFPYAFLGLEESEVTMKALYARVHGSYNGTSAGNVTWNYSVNGTSGTAQAYSLNTQAAQVGGHPYFLDLWSANPTANWINGARISCAYTPSNAANTGAMGAELMVTYQYSDAQKFTDSYKFFAYQADDGTLSSLSTGFSVFAPSIESPPGTRTRNSGYLSGTFLVNKNKTTIGTGFSVTQDIDSLSGQSHTPRTAAEAFYGTALYPDPQQLLGTKSAALTANTAVSANSIFPSANACITYSYFPPPSPPAALDQYKSDGTTPVAPGAWLNGSTVLLEAGMKSRISDTLSPVIELDPVGTDFNGAALSTGTGVLYSTTTASAPGVIAFPGLADGTVYHWRARATGPNGTSLWTSFGGNPETAADFGIDLSSPAVNPTAPLNAATTNQAAVTFTWSGTDYPASLNSGISGYLLQVSTNAGFSPVHYSSATANTQVAVLLEQNTYFWQVRALDNAGNTGSGATYSLRIDSTPASAPVLSLPLDQSATNQVSVPFQWETADDSGARGNSGISGYELYISTDPAFLVFTSSGFTAAPSLSRSLPQNYYYWRVRAKDNAQNYSAWASPWAVRVDTTSPPTPALSTPLTDFATNYATVNFAWNAVNDNATGSSGIKEYELTITTNSGFSPVYYSTRTSTNPFPYILMEESTFYWRVRAADNAGNTSGWPASRYLEYDATPPVPQRNNLPDTQQTPPRYRNADPGSFINIDFNDDLSRLNELKYRVSSLPDGGGAEFIPWTLIVSSPVNVSVYTADWQAGPWQSLQEWSTNYVHLSYSDRAGNSGTWNNAFNILKDTTPPAAPSLLSPGSGAMTSSRTLDFDWADTVDLTSGASYYMTQVATSTGISAITYSFQTVPSQATISSIADNLYYWRTGACDRAGNFSSYSSTRSFIVDTSSPVHVIGADLLGGDTTWRQLNNVYYDVDLNDEGSRLNRFEISVSTGRARALPILVNWTDSGVTIISSSTYSDNWRLPYIIWQDMLPDTTHYISLRTYDLAGNCSAYIDAFFIKKATSSVRIDIKEDKGQDVIWRSTATERAYDVDFIATVGSPVQEVQYSAYSGTNYGGRELFPWTRIPGFTPGVDSFTGNWNIGEAEFQQLGDEATNYVSVRCWDVTGTTVTARDAFVVKKDTTPPA
ncbi:MAG: fibronectin type III domain-containing protein, partial [Minisyncoccota bacterium]